MTRRLLPCKKIKPKHRLDVTFKARRHLSLLEIKKEKSKRAEFEKKEEVIYGMFSRQDKV